MSITDNDMSFEKISEPREGWFDDVCQISAKNEAEVMEQDFGAIPNTGLDSWGLGDEW